MTNISHSARTEINTAGTYLIPYHVFVIYVAGDHDGGGIDYATNTLEAAVTISTPED